LLNKYLSLLLLVALLPSCIEYRFDNLGDRERYIGRVRTIPYLDPKLGSKGKLNVASDDFAQFYLGGNYRKKRVTGNLGVIYYLSKRASIEVGVRQLLHKVESTHFGDETGTINWYDDTSRRSVYFGGKIIF